MKILVTLRGPYFLECGFNLGWCWGRGWVFLFFFSFPLPVPSLLLSLGCRCQGSGTIADTGVLNLDLRWTCAWYTAWSQLYLVVCHLRAPPAPAPRSRPTLHGSQLAVHSLKDGREYGRVITSQATSRSEVYSGWMPFLSGFLLASISLLSFLTSTSTFPFFLLSRFV